MHQIVVKVDHDYALSYADIKGLLEAKEKIEEYAREVKVRLASPSASTSSSIAPSV